MNTDFRVSVDFFDHHKARKLRRRLGADAVLSLLQLWAYAAKMRTDGSLAGMDAEDVELAARWDGDAGSFTNALVEVGFIDLRDDGMVLHDWAENNPWVAASNSRSESARSAARSKWGNSDGTNKARRSERLADARKKATHTDAGWKALVAFFDGHCVRCGKKPERVVKDHITPIYQGGCDGLRNLQPLCTTCNSSKGPENVDYRAGFAVRLGKEMPAECLRNACAVACDACGTPPPSPSPSPSPEELNTGTPNGVLVGDAAADHADHAEREAEPDTTDADDFPTSRLPDCQVQALIAAYHDELEGHPRVEIVNAKRQKAARARWIDAAKRLRQQGKPVTRDALLEYFRRYFHHAAQSDFLTGKVHSRDRHPFLADFDFLLSPKGFAGVIEGKYHQRGLLQ